MKQYLITNGDVVVVAAVAAVAAWINADAAIGASFGAMFFLLSSEERAPRKRLGYASISLCIGYGAGVAASDGWGVLLSGVVASVAVVTLTTLSRKIESGDLAGAAKMLIDVVRLRK